MPAYRHRRQRRDGVFVELQIDLVVGKAVDRGDGDRHVPLVPEMAFAEDQMRDVPVARVDQEFVHVSDIAIRGVNARATMDGQLARWNLLVIDRDHRWVWLDIG